MTANPASLGHEHDGLIDQAAASIADLTSFFEETAGADLANAADQCARLRALPERSPDDLAGLFRVMHDMKGLGGTFDYHLVTAIAEIACNVLRGALEASDEAIDAVGFAIKVMRQVIDRRIRGANGIEGQALVAVVERLSAPHYTSAGAANAQALAKSR